MARRSRGCHLSGGPALRSASLPESAGDAIRVLIPGRRVRLLPESAFRAPARVAASRWADGRSLFVQSPARAVLRGIRIGDAGALHVARATDGIYAPRGVAVKPQNTTSSGTEQPTTTTSRSSSIWTRVSEIFRTGYAKIASGGTAGPGSEVPARQRNVVEALDFDSQQNIRTIMPPVTRPKCLPKSRTWPMHETYRACMIVEDRYPGA